MSARDEIQSGLILFVERNVGLVLRGVVKNTNQKESWSGG